MDLLLKNLIDFCIILSGKVDKCAFHVSQIQDQIYYTKLSLKQNIYEILFLLILFIFINFILYFKTRITYKKSFFFILINFFFIFFTILIFQNNIPFTDTWYELDSLINTSQKNYIFTKFDNFLFGFRPFHLIIFNYFDLNYNIIIFFNVCIFFLSLIILILLADKNNSINFLFLILLIFFSGKWFNIFYEPVNIVWTTNFFLTLCFCYLLSFKKNLYINLSIILVLFLSIINFKASFVTILFSVFYGLFIESKIKNKLFFIFSPVIIFFTVNYFAEMNSVEVIDSNLFNLKNYIASTNLLLILKNFIAMQSIVFFPYIKYSVNISFLFSIFQNLVIFYFLLNGKKFKNNLTNLIKDNPLLVIGMMGCFTTTLVKQDIIQIRYFSFSLLYQIGFIFFIVNNFNLLTVLKKYLFIRNFLLVTFFLNLFFFHQGIHFAISKFTIYTKTHECLKNENNTLDCENYIYNKTFYNDKSFERKKFDNIILFLKKNNFTIFGSL